MRVLFAMMLSAGIAAAHGVHVKNPVSGATHHVTTSDDATGVLIAVLATGVLLAAVGLVMKSGRRAVGRPSTDDCGFAGN